MHAFSRRKFLALGAAGTALCIVGPAGCARDLSAKPDLDDFLHISELLTGFSRTDLDPALARRYFDLINTQFPGTAVAHFYNKAGLRSKAPPQSFAALEDMGLLDEVEDRMIADEILICWYSGTLPAAGMQRMRVATYDSALAWRSITWTTPNRECRGAFGFWSSAPPGSA
jgi:hypothetical protein